MKLPAKPHLSGTALAEALKNEARKLGFAASGWTSPDAVKSEAPRFYAFLEAQYHGDMDWLARLPARRVDPRVLWSDVQSIFVVGANYGPQADPLRALDKEETGAVSVYAQGSDYHTVLMKKLKALARALLDMGGGDVKVFVDTAAVMEKPLAQAAGIGWQGKHTNLVSREFGSWLFLGALFTTLAIASDAPEQDHCGACRRCLDICPTQAFPKPYVLDARRCISYLTIEHKGHVPRDLRAAMGNRIYGCDDCLAVCPWNKFAQAASEPAFLPRAQLDGPALSDLSDLDDTAFRGLFATTAIKRIGRDRFVRNVLIAIGNSGLSSLRDCAARRLDDASPLVRAAAIWALARLSPREEFDAIRQEHFSGETDPDVCTEWQAT